MLLDRFLSSSVVFPTDYGFVPDSIGPDGEDPAGDLQREEECRRIVEETVRHLGALDVRVNHYGTQTPVDSPEEITSEQWDGTFKTNVYGPFWTTKAALEHMGDGASIINTGSSTDCVEASR